MRTRAAGLALAFLLLLTVAAPAFAAATPPPSSALTAYAQTVRYYNRTLTWGQAYWVAGQVLRWSRAFGIPPQLLAAVIAIESSFKHNAISSRGAVGFGQLMPRTAAGMGLNPYDPLHNIYGTARKLRDLLAATGARLDLALAGYNAGLGAVRRYGGIPPYRETRQYVYKVLVLYAYLSSHPAWRV